MRLATFVCALALCSLTSAEAREPEEIAPFAPVVTNLSTPEHNLGGFLESRFRPLVRACSGPDWDFQVDRKGDLSNREFPVSVVPSELQTAFGLDRTSRDDDIYDFSQQTMNSLFSRVVSFDREAPTEVTTDLAATPPGYRALNLTILPVESQLVMPQFNGATYTMTCTNALGYLYSLRADYEFPVAAIEAGIEGSSSQTAENSIRVISGVFYSPYAAMLSGEYRRYASPNEWGNVQAFPAREARALRTTALLLFWRWYVDNARARTQKNVILEYFSGVAVSSRFNATREEALDFGSEASLRVAGLSASGRATYAASAVTAYQSRNYDIVAFRGERPVPATYMELPSPDDIVGEFADMHLSPGEAPTQITIYNTDPVTFSQSMPGLIGAACDHEAWDLQALDGGAAPARLRIQRSRHVEDQDRILQCVFDFVYTPQSLTSMELNFRIALKNPRVSGRAPWTTRVAIPGTRMNLVAFNTASWHTTDQTDLVAIDANTNQPATANTRQLRWRSNFQFFAGEGVVLTGTPGIAGGMTCGDKGRPITPVAVRPDYDPDSPRGGPLLQVLMSAAVPEGTNVNPDQTPERCHFAGSVSYTATVGGVTRSFNQPITSQTVLYPLTLVPHPATTERN